MPTFSLHSHTLYSERDAIIDPEKAAQKIKDNGGTHYAISDHGTIAGWMALRDACDKAGVVPVYGCELYINDLWPLIELVRDAREKASTKERSAKTLETIETYAPHFMTPERLAYFMDGFEELNDRDKAKKMWSRLQFSYNHLVCTAVTKEGRDALTRLHNRGWMHQYAYKPQVTTAQCIEADNECGGGLVWTTACLGGPVATSYRWDPTGAAAAQYLEQWRFAQQRFFLEVQPLDLLAQRIYNLRLITLSDSTGFPLIISQDNHHLEEDDWIAHRLLMLGQNDEPSSKIEAIYAYQGQELGFDALKKALGAKATWEVELAIQRDNIAMIQEAGHHYGDTKLHWRTNEDVMRQCETTNPELLPVLQRCFDQNDAVQSMISDIPWSHDFRIPKFEDARTKVMQVCIQVMREKGWGNDKQYVDWLKREDKVISACGFYDYIWTLYLVCKKVQDEGIPIGYARGSGGGCLIMYLLGIIRVNPVKYGLFFDRFLNPARLGLNPVTLEKEKEMASCPDVDLDFSSIHRKRVIEITKELFGEDRVVPVGTITLSKLKSAFADLCRTCGIKQADYIPVSKDLPEDPGQNMTLEEAMLVPSFAEFMDKHPIIAKYLEPLIGVAKARGQHAGGVCISDVVIADNIPVMKAGSKDDGGIVTAFGESGAVRALESVGYIKFDFLATDTVDHVSLCAKLLHQDHIDKGGQPWGDNVMYPEQIPHFTEDDPAVMQAIFHKGDTDGVFQCEEAIGKDLCALVKPDTTLEVSDISTMIRPGCLQAPAEYRWPDKDGDMELSENAVGLHYEYAARKFYPDHNPPPDGLPDNIMAELAPAHYCCIYQEQMMGLIVELTDGKMSLGEGDLYRRRIEHMGKGKPGAKEDVERLEAEMKQHSRFPDEVVDRTTTIIKGGANYSFNKSHALSYSLFSYNQAWFKHYYPHVFLAAHVTLLADKNKLQKAHKIINNMKSRGLSVAAPSLTHSSERATWSRDCKTIYLPFQVMKGFKAEASKALQAIGQRLEPLLRHIEDQENSKYGDHVQVGSGTAEDAPPSSRHDLLKAFITMALRNPAVKKNHVISMAKVGALDEFMDRQQAVATISYVWSKCTAKSTDATINKWWDDWKATAIPLSPIPKQRLMDWELQVFGGFINECPLTDKLVQQLEDRGCTPLSQVEPEDDQEFMVYFMVSSIIKKVHKPGSKYAGKEWYKLVCWDGQGVSDLNVWAKDLIGDAERGISPYRDYIMPNRCYSARISCDGKRPTSLVYRGGSYDGETLYVEQEM